MRLVFLGAPGAGKGTQARRLSAHFKILHVATGDMLRHAVSLGTPLGMRIKELIEKGDLVPDERTNELVREVICDKPAEKGFVLDGYPRNVPQALALDQALEFCGARLDKVMRFMVRGPEIVERLSGRRVCPECKAVYHVTTHPPKVEWLCDYDNAELVQREDDSPEAILHRLEVYGEQTRPLFDFYERRGRVAAIDAIGSQDEVFERILTALL